jgi:hypothetical protein
MAIGLSIPYKSTHILYQQCNLSAVQAAIISKKKRRELSPPPFSMLRVRLLNRDDALHVEREVWNAVVWVLSRLDVGE